MVQQKVGRRAWEYDSPCYCIGYCPNCKAKQVINTQQIDAFNRATMMGDAKLRINKRINFWSTLGYYMRSIRHIRIAIKPRGVDIGDNI
jgi:hypothetical protein